MPQRLPAGREQDDVRAAAQQRVGELGARVDEMLAVVQQHQQAALADRLDERGEQRPARLAVHAEHAGDGDGDEIGIVQRGEIREPHPVPGPVQQPGRGLQAEPGLARAARAGQRDQPGAAEQAAHLGELGVPADEARHLRREVVPQLRVVQRPQRRERRPAGRRPRTWKICSGRPRSFSRCRPRSVSVAPPGIESLSRAAVAAESTIWPPCATAGDPGRPVHVEADQADVGLRRLAGMDAHPDADRVAARPVVRRRSPAASRSRRSRSRSPR